MESIKCNLCRKTKPTNDFLKNGKTLKSCLDCRNKHKTVKEPIALPLKVPIPVQVKEIVPIIPEVPLIKGWKILSGTWVKENKERELHQQLTKKLIQQFKKRSAFPVHQYLMKHVFVDIRDLYKSG